MLMDVAQHEILRDELDIDQPAADMLDVPGVLRVLRGVDQRAHLQHVRPHGVAVGCRCKVARTADSIAAEKCGEPEMTRARVIAMRS